MLPGSPDLSNETKYEASLTEESLITQLNPHSDFMQFKQLVATYEKAGFSLDYNNLLCRAVSCNHIPIAGWLLTFKNASANSKNNVGDYCLHLAVFNKSESMLLLLQTHGADANLKSKYDGYEEITPIRLACYQGFWSGADIMLHSISKISEADHIEYAEILSYAVIRQTPKKRDVHLDEIIKQLLKYKGLLAENSLFFSQGSSLHAAIRNRDIQTLQWLFDSDADWKDILQEQDDYGKTLVRFAAKLGHFDCVRKIIEKTGPMKKKTAGQHRTVLLRAIKSQDAVRRNPDIDAVIQRLLQQKVGLCSAVIDDYRGDISFHAAIRNRDRTTLNWLLDAGGEDLSSMLAVKNKQDETPIELAVKLGLFDAVEKMLEHVEITTSNQDDYQSVLFAAVKAGKISIVERLLQKENGITVILNRDGCADGCLHAAVRNNDEKMVNLLLARDANLFEKNAQGLFPHQLVADRHRWEAFKIICETAKPDFFKQDLKKELLLAVEDNRIDIVRLLIAKGVQPDSSFLYSASKICNEEMIFVLLQAGCSVKIRSFAERTPAEQAAWLDFLLPYGEKKKYAICFNRAYANYREYKENNASSKDKEFKTAARKFLNLFDQNKKAPTFFQSSSDETGKFVSDLKRMLDDADSTAETIHDLVDAYLKTKKLGEKSSTLDLLEKSGLKNLVRPGERVVFHPAGQLN